MTDAGLDLQESGWEELRKEARKIEGDIDVKLSSYAKLGARFTQGGSYSLLMTLSFAQFASKNWWFALIFSNFWNFFVLLKSMHNFDRRNLI